MLKTRIKATKPLIAVLLVCLFALSGCSSEGDAKAFVVFNSQLGDFSIQLSKAYGDKKQEEASGFLMTTFTHDSGKQIRIVEEKAPSYKVDDVYFEEELKADAELHVERTEKLEMESFGTVYGALIEDHTLMQNLFYYKFNVGVNVATVLFSQTGPISEVDEKQIKQAISTLKLLKP